MLLHGELKRVALTGLPGAGKSYAMRRAAAWMAEELFHACLEGSFADRSVPIPIFADLKLYRGNLAALVNETLPGSISLGELAECFRVIVFLDSFNEMPREYWDNASYEQDLRNFWKSSATPRWWSHRARPRVWANSIWLRTVWTRSKRKT